MRTVDDAYYIDFLPSELYRSRYKRWRSLMLGNIDAIAASMAEHGVEFTTQQYSLTPKDIALLVRLKYFSEDEIERFGLREIECGVPL